MEPQVTEVQEHDAVLVVVRPALDTGESAYVDVAVGEAPGGERTVRITQRAFQVLQAHDVTASLAVPEQEDKLPRMRSSQTIMKPMLMKTIMSILCRDTS